ncbi:MAG: excinuclease ABC subunit UvrA [Clostridia bacterium]|nr:excinuclease ABC subunit UvrA [Clostridia bacterium]
MFIKIKGAKENNLKNIDVQIPKNKLIVFTGLSGSGKSTLALETLQRECQRQYMESMGMTMDIGSKPKVDCIEGLSPAISINQHQTNNNPRSTVGTVTEISAYLRVLFAKLGERPCPHCGKIITQSYSDTAAAVYSEMPDQETDNIEIFEQTLPCPHCGKQVVELTASHFSFNKPQGACPVCRGIGVVNSPDVSLLIDHSKSIREFAVSGWDQMYIDRYGASVLQAARYYGFEMDIDTPVGRYNEVQMELLLYGVLSQQFKKRFPDIAPPKTVPEGRFEGIVTSLMRRYTENSSASARQKIEKYLVRQECPECHGIRFRAETLEVKVGGINIRELLSMSLTSVSEWLKMLNASAAPEAWDIVRQVVVDLDSRIDRIIDAGAGYLSLDQPASSLSAGEWQRIKLASVLGSGLTGVLYVLDEPTSGLHSRDTERIIEVLKRLRDMGNTVIVIEHDVEVMKAADYIIDFGPGAGKNGGKIVACGGVQEIIGCDASITGKYLQNSFYQPKRNKLPGGEGYISIRDAAVNNLKNINVDIPLGRFVTVTGVSGSGKSSLIFGHLAEAAEIYFHQTKKNRKPDISGLDKLTAAVIINQQSIGRSNRSNAATYTDLFTDIRDLFASMPETKARGLTAKHFSYNVPGGRCEKCQGTGRLSISMHFLPDVEVVCPVCRGKRYQKPVLDIKYSGYNISDVLELSIDEAVKLFSEEENIVVKLQILQDVGLGYLGLGQSTATLSGGEAQRLKLAKELSAGAGGRVLYLFDEPTTGLHPHDAGRLVTVFDRLVKLGNSVVVIEHNAEMILESDWVIDLGPEGGNEGGEIVAQGSPEEIMKNSCSHTGKVLSSLYCKL